MYKYNIDFQLAPPNMHHQNAAEWVIQFCKNIFISGFSTTRPDLPIIKWDHLLFQCLITLNILLKAIFNPDLSAYSYLYGPFNFNNSFMALPELTWLSMTNLTIARHGTITSHKVGILVHHFTIIDACTVICLKLTLCVSIINCNKFQNH